MVSEFNALFGSGIKSFFIHVTSIQPVLLHRFYYKAPLVRGIEHPDCRWIKFLRLICNTFSCILNSYNNLPSSFIFIFCCWKFYSSFPEMCISKSSYSLNLIFNFPRNMIQKSVYQMEFSVQSHPCEYSIRYETGPVEYTACNTHHNIYSTCNHYEIYNYCKWLPTFYKYEELKTWKIRARTKIAEQTNNIIFMCIFMCVFRCLCCRGKRSGIQGVVFAASLYLWSLYDSP